MGKVLIALSISAAFTLTGCNTTHPCAQLPPPTPQQIAVAVPPVEVEQEGLRNYDCEVRNGQWQIESDDE